jgi:hypothetical protein
MDKKIIQKTGKYFTVDERHKIIQDFLSSQCTKAEIWEKYTGQSQEHLGAREQVVLKDSRPHIVYCLVL